ncbi:MAG: hypothetical protein AAF789_11010 [Bacteroidota bacterium]
MKQILSFALLIASTLFIVSCGDDDETIITTSIKGTEVSENITGDVTWTAGSQITLSDRIAVVAGATLTIEPGVVIYGLAGSGANATALIVAAGATLDAQGTSSSPIIFTSIADDIEPGMIDSPNLSADLDGLWGGLIVLGNAVISVANDNETKNIEGIPATDPNGIYGGTNNAEGSSTIRYVSCRHGGSNIGEGNEINGITFGGVGTGTTISWIEVVGTQDDGVEFFGGSVNADNVLVWNNGDDAIDTDEGYIGTINNGLLINPGDKAFEIDGGEGSDEPAQTITNFSVDLGAANGSIDVDGDSHVSMTAIYFYGLTEDTGTSYDMQLGTVDTDPSTPTNSFTSIEIENTFDDDDGNPISVTAGTYLADVAAVTIVSTPTIGATVSAFDGWTMADARNAY